MFMRIWNWFKNLSDITGLPRTIGEAITLVALAGVAIRQWMEGLDQTQLILILIALFGLVVVGITYLLEWRRNRSVRYIPTLLYQMDEKMKCLIETAQCSQDKMEKFIDDAGELWDIDIQKLKDAYKAGNIADIKATIIDEMDKFSKQHQLPPSAPQPFTIVKDLLRNLTGLMSYHEIGITSIKDYEYEKFEKHLEVLKKRVKQSRTINTINSYLFWWSGLSNLLLLYHYDSLDNVLPDLLPAKVKAAIPTMQTLIQTAIEEYMGYIKDNVYGNKRKEQ